MRYIIIATFILASLRLTMRGAEPYCIVTTYGYGEGVPAGSGSRVVEDRHGFIWVATWNGLYRYDGYEFRPIRPKTDNAVRRYSSRYRDIKTGPDGRMWCRIDDNIVLFDVDTYDFHDLQSEIEKATGKKMKIENAIRESTDGDVVLNVSDGSRLIFDAKKLKEGCNPVDAMKISDKEDPVKLKKGNFHKAPLPSQFERNDVAFSMKDKEGGLWIIMKDGRIMNGESSENRLQHIASINTDGGSIKFNMEDGQGHLWMVSNAGIHKIDLGTSPLSYLSAPEPSQLRASMTDSQGRVWMSWSDSGYVAVYDNLNSEPSYLSADGRLSANPVKFGLPVYSMAEGPSGEIWLGSKPDGLFRLIPIQGNAVGGRGAAAGGTPIHGYAVGGRGAAAGGTPIHGYAVGAKGNYYDLAFDGKGRLWMATLGNGIEVMENPSEHQPKIISLIERKGYPQEADKARRIRIIGDSLIVATTTEGLLSFPMPQDVESTDIKFTLHRSAPGDEHSLGNIATMDALPGKDGRLYVATESDGLNILTSPLSTSRNTKWRFSGFDAGSPSMTETTLTIGLLPDGRVMAVGKQDINIFDPSESNDIEVLGSSLWKRNPTFKEVSPLRVPDGRWLIGLSDGAVAIDIEKDITQESDFPVEFISYNIEGGPEKALSPMTEVITLGPKERAMTLSFAALCYSDTETVRYAYRVDDSDDWIPIGNLRTLTFTRLEPGKHKVSVRSSDLTGRWQDNTRSLIIEVKPKFHETALAKTLGVLVILGVAGGVVWTIVNMRRLRRKQRETLEAYLSLLEARTTAAYDQHQPDSGATETTPETTVKKDTDDTAPLREETEINVNIPEEDKEMISKVVAYIEQNFPNSGITVDDMANAVAVSKSTLTKKMKSLMGVTPAEFLRTTRLSKSKVMLKETNLPIKEIALDCGFADMNYFGKCFKGAYGVTPTAWRGDGKC